MPKIITDLQELSKVEKWAREAEDEAKKSKCIKSQVGVVIVKDGKVISTGYNKISTSSKCFVNKKGYCSPCIRKHIHDNSQSERCFAIHAEQMALINARADLTNAVMYHAKIKNGVRTPIEVPACTVCNRMIKEAAIHFVTLQKEGYVRYSPEELNDISFKKLLNHF